MKHGFKMGMAGLLCCAWVHASTGVSCLLDVQVLQVRDQPMDTVLQVQVLAAANDHSQRNDIECSQAFPVGMTLWLSPEPVRAAPSVRRQQKIRLLFTYGDDRGGAVWRRYRWADFRQPQTPVQ